ncbi:STM4015 family protein [Nonomuraea sp. NPDC050786]|uniref:STM4015 family protein n=1 Tax=Nonomuraea sp. NPDC050786 TaxID=3154840 RepID=UPI0033D6C380
MTDDDYPSHWDRYHRTYAGLPTAMVPWDEENGPQPDAGSVAWRLSAYGPDGEAIGEHLDWLFEHVDTAKVTAVVIGLWEDCDTQSSAPVVRRLAEEAGRLPELRSLFFGAISPEECEISWIQQSDITPLLEAYPKLERLEVRGGSELRLSPVRHESLKVLRFESGGLPGEVVRAVAASDLPALEHLELWLGVPEYGGDSGVSDVGPILRGERLPALRHLGLQDSEIQDDLAAAVATAPIVARLETLSLSMGALSDAGAEALLSGQPLTHLRALDLHHHYLSEAMVQRVIQALPGVRVDVSEQEKADVDEDGGEAWRYVAVDE